MHMTIGNEFAELARVAEAIEEFARREGVGASAVDDINLAVDELLTNTMRYGYPGGGRDQIAICVYREARGLVVIIADSAKEFDPRGRRQRKQAKSIEEYTVGGLGLFFVQEMTDGLEYHRSEGRNVTTIRKEVGARVAQDTKGHGRSEDGKR